MNLKCVAYDWLWLVATPKCFRPQNCVLLQDPSHNLENYRFIALTINK